MDGRKDGVCAAVAAAGHFQILSGGDALGAVFYGTPVSDYHALVAPAIAQDVGQQLFVLRAVGAVELVVGSHHAQGLCLFDHRLKGGKVDLVQGALVHHAVACHPVGLLIVGGKMLDATAHTVALDAVDQCRPHLTAEIGILAEILKVASAQGAALDVQAGTKQQGQILGAALVAQRFTELFCQSCIEAGSNRCT